MAIVHYRRASRGRRSRPARHARLRAGDSSTRGGHQASGRAPDPPTYYRVPMTSADGSDEFRRRFDEIVAEMSPDDIHEMLGALMGPGSITGARAPRPDLRRTPLEEPAVL